jgi:hypothetical protein
LNGDLWELWTLASENLLCYLFVCLKFIWFHLFKHKKERRALGSFPFSFFRNFFVFLFSCFFFSILFSRRRKASGFQRHFRNSECWE